MRRVTFMAVGLVTLALAGLSVAAGLDVAQSAKSVAGTFTATTASATTRTCKAADGKTIAVTNAKYSGTAAGDADLAGPIRIAARSVINTTDDIGAVDGKLRIDVVSGGDTVAHFSAVYDHGKLAGIAIGHVQEPHAKLLANLSAGFGSGGFTGGKIGNSAGGSAVELGPGRCEPSQAQAEKSEATGTVSALSQTSITVAGLTCTLPVSLAAKVNSTVKIGDRVRIRCSLVNGQNTLVKIGKKR